MGSSSSRINSIPDAQQLMQETGFSAAHIVRLHERFESLDTERRGELSPEDFELIPELAMNPVGGRIIGAFFPPSQETVNFASFVRILAHFRPAERSRGSRGGAQQELANCTSRKLQFAFQLYDQDRDGKISREELLQVLRAMLGIQVTEEQLQSIVERAIQEADLDGDDAISFDEFKKSLAKVNVDHKMSTGFLR
ncbi:calcineurin B homologous protein 2 isoform X1 [Nelusetta ayraudi]|uniref:calcineurin B homologous protein 2 isoform X1 n=1 Tax=Nelusetta ayraudi TaxID=303726 RepID=UPI003F6F9705